MQVAGYVIGWAVHKEARQAGVRNVKIAQRRSSAAAARQHKRFAQYAPLIAQLINSERPDPSCSFAQYMAAREQYGNLLHVSAAIPLTPLRLVPNIDQNRLVISRSDLVLS